MSGPVLSTRDVAGTKTDQVPVFIEFTVEGKTAINKEIYKINVKCTGGQILQRGIQWSTPGEYLHESEPWRGVILGRGFGEVTVQLRDVG